MVGRGPGKYALYIGGSHRGERLAGLAFQSVPLDEIPARLRPLLLDFKEKRRADETFSDYWG
ncbi:MAG: NADPH-dependent assimilatory sulfite reductase hemoprotein subunit, partial [Anaerolineae bacterium]